MINIGTLVNHSHYGKGKVIDIEDFFYKIDFGAKGIMEIAKRTAEEMLEILQEKSENTTINMDELEKTLIRILNDYSDIQKPIELGDRWKGGKMVLHPENPSQKSKEIPIETFFHKIVMVRDRLRVLEQNINSQDKLSDEEKINLQQYITRIYGSLTTFNVLFKEEGDHFIGGKGE